MSGKRKMAMSKGTELPDWNGKFPKRYGCQYPYSKCESCYHDKPCVPDYADEYKKEKELSSADKFTIVFWLTALALAATWLYFIKF